MANCEQHTETRERLTEVMSSVKSAHYRLDAHDEAIDKHNGKIDCLEKSDATNTTKIDNLCGQIGGLTKAIWGLVSSVLLVLIGFLIWYIQNIKK